MLFRSISSTTRRRGRSAWDRNVSEWIQKELGKLPKRNRPKLYLAGEKSFVLPVFRKLRYRNISLTWAGNPIEEHSLSRIEAAIREELDAEAKSRIRQTFKEFHLADDLSLGCRNLFDIASAAVKGRVSKLVVSSDMQIFGKIDEASGRLKLNPGDSDHEDDDILDDLAQLVLANGGEVQLAPLSEMPKGWPAVAILHPAARENQLSTLSNSLKKSQQEIA